MNQKTIQPVVIHFTDVPSNENYSFETGYEELRALRDLISELTFADFKSSQHGDLLAATFPAHRIMDCLDKLLATKDFNDTMNQLGKKE